MKKILVLLLFFIYFIEASEIKNYKVLNDSIKFDEKSFTLLRSFEINHQSFYLVVDENSLKTYILKKEELKDIRKNKIENTKYKKLLDLYSKSPYILQNYGLKHLNTKSVYLTIDMCPSSKVGYEDSFFKALAIKYKKAIPLTIFISGKWIKTHENYFKELVSYEKDGIFDITWGNHTFTHHYNSKEILEKNFLLTSNVDIEDEIIKSEKVLLSYGITPSILFRAPGLVSDEKVINIIKKFGLITVGSDTWLAKDEDIHNGSVILIHGNKNEPYGIKRASDTLLKSDFTLGSLLDDI